MPKLGGQYTTKRSGNRPGPERTRSSGGSVTDYDDLYRLLFDTLPQGVVHQGADGKIISMNPAAERILGKSPADFIGETSVSVENDTIREDGSPFPGLEHPAMVALRTGKEVRDVVMGVYNPREKAYRWINITAIPLLRQGSSEPYQVYTIFEDVTERRALQEAQRKNERSYRSIIEASPWGLHFYELTDDGRLVFTGANPTATRILGIDHSSLIGLTLEEAFPANVGTELPDAYRRVARTGKEWRSDRIDYADGRVQGAFQVHAFQPAPGHVAAAFVDITDRIRTEESVRNLLKAAQQEKDRLMLLMNSMSEEVWFADANGDFTLANTSALKVFGWTTLKEKVDVHDMATHLEVRRADGSIRPPEEAPPLRALKGETVVNEDEMIRMPKSGELRHRRVSSAPVRDASGTIIGSVSVVRDVTEKLAEQEAFRSTRDYLESLFGYANAPIIVWDPAFTITRFNHAFERMTGYSANEVIGKQLSMLFPDESREPSITKISQTLAGEFWQSVEIPILCKNGGVRVALWNSANIASADGKGIIATIAQGQDITARKEAEDALRSTQTYLENLFDYANAPIIVWDPSFKITRFNHAFERMTGHKADEVIGKDLSMLFPSDSREASLINISKTLAGEYWQSVEIPILRRDGVVRVALWNSANIYEGDGKALVATIAQGQDITERKEAEMRLEENSMSLARSNMELQRFAYVASHDLKEPLRTISGFMQILATDYGDKLDEKAKDYINRAVRASTRLHDMIEDLLSFSRLETRKGAFTKVDLNEVLTSAIHDLEKTIEEHKGKVTAEPLPIITADELQMNIVFRNLIDNAVKFHSTQPPRLQVKAARKNDEWLISFKDNGIGIDPMSHGKIFDMFSRLHSWKEYPGNGIGLAMCKKIVERHGGRIWVESEQGKGSTFFVTLPDFEKVIADLAVVEAEPVPTREETKAPVRRVRASSRGSGAPSPSRDK